MWMKGQRNKAVIRTKPLYNHDMKDKVAARLPPAASTAASTACQAVAFNCPALCRWCYCSDGKKEGGVDGPSVQTMLMNPIKQTFCAHRRRHHTESLRYVY